MRLLAFPSAAFYLKFDIIKKHEENDNRRGDGYLAVTIDLKAKIVRKDSLLVTLNKQRGIQEGGDYTREWTSQEIAAAQNFIGSVVLYSRDRKTYTVMRMDFDHTWDTLMIPGTNMSHTQYFTNQSITLEHKLAKPILVVRGRRGAEIYFPPEMASLNELPPEDRDRLPQIASFLPSVRNVAVDSLVSFLKKRGVEDDDNLLTAAGFRVGERKTVKAHVLPRPDIEAAIRGSKVDKTKLDFFPGVLKGANYQVNGNDCTELRGVVFYNSSVSDPRNSAMNVYERIAGWVNGLNAKFRLSRAPFAMFETGSGDGDPHVHAVREFLRSNQDKLNLFIIDFCKPPRGAKTDPAYHPVKRVLMEGGFVSQFVNYNSANHFDRSNKTSGVILVSVARQILCKAGVRLYWSHIPPELPTPVMFVGIDITHAPFEFNQTSQRRVRASSYAAVVTETRLGEGKQEEIIAHSRISRRGPGEEFNLADLVGQTVRKAVQSSGITPRSVIVWRDGISESASVYAMQELEGLRKQLEQFQIGDDQIPVAFVVCQKLIGTKLYYNQETEAPSGTFVDQLSGLDHETFYINGRAPDNSTSRPTRFIVMHRDEALKEVRLPELTWAECHTYQNWAGPVKVPAVTQNAHKLAYLVGDMGPAGQDIDVERPEFENKLYYL